MNKLFQRSCLRLMDFTKSEINKLLKLAINLKYQKHTRLEIKKLIGKNIVLIFEKDSTRTRCSFEIAALDQGAHVTYIKLNENNNQINYKESIKDTARILSNIYDGIQYRGYEQNTIKILSNYSNIPVWNGLTNEFHPTQILSDILTMKEYLPEKKINQIKIAYIGIVNNNIGKTLLEIASITGLKLRLISPINFWPNNYKLFIDCMKLAKKNNNIIFTENILYGIKNVDFIYTDVWVSLGENKKLWNHRIKLLKNYQVNLNMLKKTGNPKIKFLHCLPAFHNKETVISKDIINKYNLFNGIEVSDEVFESSYSLVFNQAENKLHMIKAIMIATMLKIK